MTREETLKLLQFLKGCYPNTKIDDPQGMVQAWMLAFSDRTAEDVYKGARFHMMTNKFFPTPADIQRDLSKALILYSDYPNPPLPPDTPLICDHSGIDEEMLRLWDWLVT